MCLGPFPISAYSLFSLRRMAEASRAFSADAILLAFVKLTGEPQYGQVLVFWSALASRRPLHLLHWTIMVDVMFCACPKTFSRSS